jgi:hypothetical protein
VRACSPSAAGTAPGAGRRACATTSDRARCSAPVEEVVAELEPYRAVGVGRVMLQHLLHDDIDAVAVLGDVARRLAG